jgi:diadenosine tetraphosphate (Ap4A) HIT family hydrolase
MLSHTFAKLIARRIQNQMNSIPITYSITMSIGRDAGNASMHRHQHSVWAEDDWNAAAEAMQTVLNTAELDGGLALLAPVPR